MSTLMPGMGEIFGGPAFPREQVAARLGPAEVRAEDARRSAAHLEEAVERAVLQMQTEDGFRAPD